MREIFSHERKSKNIAEKHRTKTLSKTVKVPVPLGSLKVDGIEKRTELQCFLCLSPVQIKNKKKRK